MGASGEIELSAGLTQMAGRGGGEQVVRPTLRWAIHSRLAVRVRPQTGQDPTTTTREGEKCGGGGSGCKWDARPVRDADQPPRP